MTHYAPSPSPATRSSGVPAERLRAALRGQVITPEDPGYDEARTVFYGGYDQRPALIARVADVADVAQVIAFARERGLELAVRGGGHSVAGHSGGDGGIVLDLVGLKGLMIDRERRTAWAEAGLTAGEYTAAAAEYGLATGFGDTGSVGIGGITLGGGVGYLVRKYGLTIDDLLAAEVVTADGQLLHVDAETHPDLFWALRGGGGNFGVVTRFKYRLHELSEVFGGMLVLPATPEVIAGFVAAAEAAPEELSTIANVMTAPPMPFLPPELHGQLVVLAMLVYAGAGGAAERAIAPFRALAAPLADMLRPMRYVEIYPPEEGGYHPVAQGRTLFVERIDHDVAATIVKRLKTSTAAMAVTQIRVLGGAMARVPADATAFAHRGRPIMINVAAVYQRQEEGAAHAAWVEAFAEVLRQGDSGAYVNFLAAEGEARVRAAYPGATWERLAAIKRRYDPSNLFRRNHNIPPAARGGA
jgi:FAD/FMN-containing dehydrogenase